MSKSFFLRSLLLGAIIVPAPVFAADATFDEAAELEGETGSAGNANEIVVSARRRDERAQDVPISLSTVDAGTLGTTSYSNLTQISSLVPSVNIRGGNPRNTYINIRGLGSNSTQNDGLEIGVGTYIDDVYYGRVGSSQFDMIDLERVEVLRGPQGTLFGKNTTAGAINITTRAPSFTPEFRGEASVGESGYWQVRGSASTGIIPDLLAVRLTGSYGKDHGFYRNAYNGKRAGGSENLTLRGQLLLTPSPSLNIRLIGDYSRQSSTNSGGTWTGVFTEYANGAPIPNNIIDRLTRLNYSQANAFGDPYARIISMDAPSTSRMNSAGVSAKGELDLGAATLTSITAWRQWNWSPQNDTDGTSLDINPKGGTANRQRQFSQELRLASNGKRTVDYVVGAYYFWQVIHALSEYRLGSDYAAWNNPTADRRIANYALTGFQANSAAEPRTNSYALFGQATWNVSDAFSVTGGLRFTHEDRQASYNQYTYAGNDLSVLSEADRIVAQRLRDTLYPATSYFLKTSDDALTGQINLAYKVAPDVLVFASYARGVKSGGVNVGQLPAGISGFVAPEKVDAYEVGLKSQFWDRRITANISGFWTEVSDYQAAIAEQIGETTSVRRYISNIPGVRSRGFEADFAVAPVDGLRLTAAFAYTDTTYKSYPNAQPDPEIRNVTNFQDLSGTQLPGIPKFSYTLSLDYSRPVRILGDDEVYFRGDFNHRSSTSGTSIYSSAPGYGLLNARVGVRIDDGRWDLSLWARNLLNKKFATVSGATTGLITTSVGDPQQLGATLRAAF